MLEHHGGENFSVRKKVYDETIGLVSYKSKHFNVKCDYLSEKRRRGCKINIDYNNVTFRIKRPPASKAMEDEDSEYVNSASPLACSGTPSESSESVDSETVTMQSILDLLPDVLNVMNEMERSPDFISVLKAIADRKLQGNIALHLLLDVGQFLRQNTVYSMRYHPVTREFWTLVHKLFKGKGLRFFTGLKGEGQDRYSGMLVISHKLEAQ